MDTGNQWQTANEAGFHLYQDGHYDQAEQIFRAALQAAETFGPEDTRVAVVLNNLANLCHNQGKLEEAESHYQRALAIRREKYGPDHPFVAQSMNNMAALYRELGKLDEAEEFLHKVLVIAEELVGPEHWRITNCLNNLAAVYMDQTRYAEASALFERSLTIRTRFFGADHHSVATRCRSRDPVQASPGDPGRKTRRRSSCGGSPD
jgi:tetratricopeptide (TPR) repeat protein